MNLLGKLAILSFVTLSLAAAPATVKVSASAEWKPPAATQQDGKDQQEHRHKHGHRLIHGGHIVKDTANMLEMKPQVLVDQLKQGKSLLQVVQSSKGWTEAQYLQKLTESAHSHIAQAQAEGKISAEDAARLKSRLPDKLKRIIHRTWNQPAPGHPALEYKQNQINWMDQPK